MTKRPGTETTERDDALLGELASELPDQPRWVEARGLLLSGRCRVLFGPEGRTTAGFFVIDRDRPLVCAVGRPVDRLVEELRREFPDKTELLANAANADRLRGMLAGWVARPVTAHIHPNPVALPGPRHDVRLLRSDDQGDEGDEALCEGLPPALAAELSLALATAPAAATFVDGAPVAFCYAAYETESWWDVSVDTLVEHRRRGYASSAAAFLIRHMLARGKAPVWGALDANQASLAMAAKYGFRAVHRMILFTPPTVGEKTR